MVWETILFEKTDKIGIITLNRPDKLNTFTPQFLKEFDEAVNTVADDPEVRVVVLKANGRVFSAGGDFELLKTLDTPTKARAAIRSLGNTIAKIYKLWSLVRLTGVMRAKELAMTGRMIDAKEAAQYGMVLKVVPSEKLYDEVMCFARQIAAKAPVAIGFIKQLVNRLSDISLEAYFDLEADYMGIALQTEDHKEGLTAFIEKREPKFKGK